jgi:protein-L-isoaspartate O-methyltransferase
MFAKESIMQRMAAFGCSAKLREAEANDEGPRRYDATSRLTSIAYTPITSALTYRTPLRFFLAPLLALTLCGQNKSGEKLAPYFPTPATIVDKMLELGGLKPGEKMYDLGSGDGRIVIMAARKYKADATGVELDESLYKQSSERIKTLGLAPTARIIHGDLLQQAKTLDIDDDGEGRSHRLFLYKR